MHVSLHAQRLLDAGHIIELQALSYEELLSQAVRDEILASFLTPSQTVLVGDSVPNVLQDPTSYETLSDACVISSGQIFSRSTIESYLTSRQGREITCPLTRQALRLDIGHTGLAYVLLRKIDEVIRGFKVLYLRPRAQAKLHSYAPERVLERPEGPLFHSAMAVFHGVPTPLQDRPVALTEPSLKLTPDRPVGTIEVKVARNKLRVVVVLNEAYGNVFSDQMEQYFNTTLPNSKVNLSCRSYSMSQESFGRCWKKLSHQRFELDFWFPPNESTLKKRTFSDHHLARLLTIFSAIINSPEETAVEEAAIPACVISEIPPKTYVVALPATPATFEQLGHCCQTFLESTRRTAEKLHYPVNDTVITHDHTTSASRTSGLGIFGGGQTGAPASSSTSVQFGQRK